MFKTIIEVIFIYTTLESKLNTDFVLFLTALQRKIVFGWINISSIYE